VWPDVPPAGSLTAQKPPLMPSDARADAVLPASKAQTTGAAVATQSPHAAPQAPAPSASPAATFFKISLVVALGLGVAGLLYRVVTKMAAAPGRRTIDYGTSDWTGGRFTRASRDDQHRGFVYESEGADVRPSLVPAAGDDGARRKARTDAVQNNARVHDTASRTARENSVQQDTLAQLIRDLDDMLQSRKRA
jgi:hypothetical protein